jgi:hypothetical protein
MTTLCNAGRDAGLREASYLPQVHSILIDPMQQRETKAEGVLKVVRLSDSQRAAWYFRKDGRRDRLYSMNPTISNTIIK